MIKTPKTNEVKDTEGIKILRPEGRILPNIVFAPEQYQRRIREVLSCDRNFFRDNPQDKGFFRHQIRGEFGPQTGEPQDIVWVQDLGPEKSCRVPHIKNIDTGKHEQMQLAVFAYKNDTIMYVVNRETRQLIQRINIGRWWEEENATDSKEEDQPESLKEMIRNENKR